LQQVKQELRRRMHEPVPLVGQWSSLNRFRGQIQRYWRQTLRRRSQKARVAWNRLERLFNRWLPLPKLVHPYPGVRFAARHPR
jgi:RNA-directed DNA polymerase